jgi:Flp pilus assembly protein TadG
LSSENRMHVWVSRWSLAHWVRAAVRGRRGIASIEFGIVMAGIVVIVLGTYDIGNYVLQEMKLADAAHAGGQYAMSYPTDTAGMTAAIDAVLPWPDVTVTEPTTTCGCWSSGGGESAADCSANPVCPSGETVERFITITLQRNYSPLLVMGLTSTTESYVARVQ